MNEFFCKNCGKPIPQGKTYCPYCGNTFQEDFSGYMERPMNCAYAPPEILFDNWDEDTASNAYPLNYTRKSKNHDE